MSYVGIFAGRRNETEAIDNLLDKFHRTNDLTEQKKCIDEIYLNITKYLVREGQGRNRGARWAAYNDLLTMVNRCDLNYKNPNEIFLAKKKSIPVAIKDFVHFSVKCDSSGIKDLKNYPHSKLIDKLYNSKENYTFNGYLSVFIDIHDIKNITIHDNYKAILTWVSELGRLGKVRFNCHGDGQGNLTMQSLAKVNGERPQNSIRESCNGDNIINWMIGNNYFSHCIEANYKTTQKATFEASRNYSVNNTNVNSYAGTISVAACMAGREKLNLTKNLTAYHSSPRAVAHDDSLLSCMLKNLNKSTLPVIKLTGAHEVVSNTDTHGMQRDFTLNYFKDKRDLATLIKSTGNINSLEIQIPDVTLNLSVSGNELCFKLNQFDYYKNKNGTEIIFQQKPTTATTATTATTVPTVPTVPIVPIVPIVPTVPTIYSFDSNVYSIYGAGNEIYIAPPHGFTIIEDSTDKKLYLQSEHVIKRNGSVKIRLAHSASKLEIFTNGL